MCFRPERSLKSWMRWESHIYLPRFQMSIVVQLLQCTCFWKWQENASQPVQMLSFMRAQYTLFQQGFNILDEIDPYMKKLAAQVSKTKCAHRPHAKWTELLWFSKPASMTGFNLLAPDVRASASSFKFHLNVAPISMYHVRFALLLLLLCAAGSARHRLSSGEEGVGA